MALKRERHTKNCVVVQLIHPSPLRLRQLQSARGDLIFLRFGKMNRVMTFSILEKKKF